MSRRHTAKGQGGDSLIMPTVTVRIPLPQGAAVPAQAPQASAQSQTSPRPHNRENRRGCVADSRCAFQIAIRSTSSGKIFSSRRS
jgi:hypothetical protein